MLDAKTGNMQFWWLWVWASAMAGAAIALGARAAAYSVGYAAGEVGGTIGAEVAVGAVAMGGFLGGIGLAQGLALAGRSHWAGWWMLASAMSGVASGAAFLGVRAALLSIASDAAAAPAGGIAGLTVLWLVQWYLLRRRVQHAHWLAASAGLGLVAAVVGAAVMAFLFPSEWASGLGFGAGYGAITGTAILYLDRRATI